MKTYNHAYTIGFSTLSKHSDSDDDPVTKEELFAGIMRRMSDLLLNNDEILEAVGKPFDTYVEEDYPDPDPMPVYYDAMPHPCEDENGDDYRFRRTK